MNIIYIIIINKSDFFYRLRFKAARQDYLGSFPVKSRPDFVTKLATIKSTQNNVNKI